MSAKSRYRMKPIADSEETPANTSRTIATRRKSDSSEELDTTSRKRSSSTVQDEPNTTSRKRSSSTSTSSRRNSQSSERELPSAAFSSDNEYISSPKYSPTSPMNIDEIGLNVQSNLREEEEIKVARLVRHFINVFVQNPNLWNEFKEVMDSTSQPVTIPSAKGKEVQRHNPVSAPVQVIYN
jgi:hypothetical protein